MTKFLVSSSVLFFGDHTSGVKEIAQTTRVWNSWTECALFRLFINFMFLLLLRVDYHTSCFEVRGYCRTANVPACCLYLLLAETPHSFSLGLCWYVHLGVFEQSQFVSKEKRFISYKKWSLYPRGNKILKTKCAYSSGGAP